MYLYVSWHHKLKGIKCEPLLKESDKFSHYFAGYPAMIDLSIVSMTLKNTRTKYKWTECNIMPVH